MAPSAIEVQSFKSSKDTNSTQDADDLKLSPSTSPIPSKFIGKLRPTKATAPIEEIRKRYEEDGYVWLKGLLPTEDVWKARKDYFEFLQPSGLIKEGTNPQDGIYCGSDPNLWTIQDLGSKNPEFQNRLTAAHSAPWYLAFANHPILRDFVKKFTRWYETTQLMRSLFRPNVPGGEPTGIHYDQIYLRGGPATALTAWVPLGNIALNGGGLMYLEDSVSLGFQLEDAFTEAAKDMPEAERVSAFNKNMMSAGFLSRDPGGFAKRWGRKWLTAEYDAGDVVLHHPCNIHCSAVNEAEAVRLATDLRFVETGKRFDERWMGTWNPDDRL